MSQAILPVVPAIAKCPSLGFLHTRQNSRMIPAFIQPEATQTLRDNWDTTEHDIIICTHQKVGTHLTKKYVVEILRAAGILADGHPAADGDIGKSAVPWPEVMVSQHGYDAFSRFLHQTEGQTRIFYTHANADELPVRNLHPKTKVVMTYRDPKGAAVSQYHFYKSHPVLGVSDDLTMSQFVDLFIEGDLYFGDYHDHVTRYFNAKRYGISEDQLCIVRFEDLVEDKLASVRKLAAFLLPFQHLDEQTVMSVAASTEFNTMKEGIRKNPGSFHFNPERFFRSGKTEDWKDQLDATDVEAINAKTAKKWGNPEAVAPKGQEAAMSLANLAA